MVDGRGTGGGVYALLAIVVVLLVVIILFLTGTLGGRQGEPDADLRIDIDAPEAPQPQTPQPGN